MCYWPEPSKSSKWLGPWRSDAVPPAYYVTIHSNAPNFNRDLEYPLDKEFRLPDGRLCAGLIVSMQCALTRGSDDSPSRPFMCEFSEGAR
jgi:hypothetical protein